MSNKQDQHDSECRSLQVESDLQEQLVIICILENKHFVKIPGTKTFNNFLC